MNRQDYIEELRSRVDLEEFTEYGYAVVYSDMFSGMDVSLHFDDGPAIFRMQARHNGVDVAEWHRFAWTGDREEDLLYAIGRTLEDLDDRLLRFITTGEEAEV